MSSSTLTRADLTEAIYEEVGLSRNESADLVESVLEEVASCLVDGENVKVSSFGSFLVRQKNGRMAAIPKPAKKCQSIRAAFSCSDQVR